MTVRAHQKAIAAVALLALGAASCEEAGVTPEEGSMHRGQAKADVAAAAGGKVEAPSGARSAQLDREGAIDGDAYGMLDVSSLLSPSAGELEQLAGTAGCVSEDGSGGTCADGNALDGPEGLVVSPDGANVYLASQNSGALVIFDRHLSTGALTQKPGLTGCISDSGTSGTCAGGTGLGGLTSVRVSPDNAHVYGAAFGALTVFDRDLLTGALTQKPGPQGCITETGDGGACADGALISGIYQMTLSPGGESAYATSYVHDAILVFDRHATTGVLTQKASPHGCHSETGAGGLCTAARGLLAAYNLTVSPDGTSLYAVSMGSSAITTFDRDPISGALTQKAGAGGCLSAAGGLPSCGAGNALLGAAGVAVSPNGKSVYVASMLSSAVAVFDRDPTTGALTQKPGTLGCISDTGTAGLCTAGEGLTSPHWVTVSGDGNSVYVLSFAADGVVAVFDRSPVTGELTQKSGTAGCTSDSGSSGGCEDGRALGGTVAIALSPGGGNAYISSNFSDAVTIFSRHH